MGTPGHEGWGEVEEVPVQVHTLKSTRCLETHEA